MSSFPVPDGPHNDPWKELLAPCFAVVDAVTSEHKVDFPIRIGGGSMLLRRYRHRKSKDLDLFVSDVRLARWCSPRFNEAAMDLFPDYSEEGTAVKLIIGMQEVDVIAVAPIMSDDEALDAVIIKDRSVLVERPREILAKKIIYRGRTFQPRDIFDLACVATAEPAEVAAILPYLNPTNIDDLTASFNAMEPVLNKELGNKVEAFAEFEPVLEQCLEISRGVVEAWRANLIPKVDVPPFPRDTHRAFFSRDGRSVVIRRLNPNTRRHDVIDNPLGFASVSPEESAYYVEGEKVDDEEWRRRFQEPRPSRP
jgi:hypothetical protein